MYREATPGAEPSKTDTPVALLYCTLRRNLALQQIAPTSSCSRRLSFHGCRNSDQNKCPQKQRAVGATAAWWLVDAKAKGTTCYFAATGHRLLPGLQLVTAPVKRSGGRQMQSEQQPTGGHDDGSK